MLGIRGRREHGRRARCRQWLIECGEDLCACSADRSDQISAERLDPEGILRRREHGSDSEGTNPRNCDTRDDRRANRQACRPLRRSDVEYPSSYSAGFKIKTNLDANPVGRAWVVHAMDQNRRGHRVRLSEWPPTGADHTVGRHRDCTRRCRHATSTMRKAWRDGFAC